MAVAKQQCEIGKKYCEEGYKMKLKDIAELSCKILSITVLIKFIFYLNVFFSYFAQNEYNPINRSLFQTSIVPVLLLLISIILWCFAKKIASLMVKDSASLDNVINFEYYKIKPMVLSTIGLIILTKAIPSFIKKIMQVAYSRF